MSSEPPVDMAVAGFLAGLAAGFARVVVGHPFDTMKVLTQTNQLGSAHHRVRPSWQALCVLYRGITPPLIASCAQLAPSFCIYEASILALQPVRLPSVVEAFLAGTASGVPVSFVFCPLANVRVLQQTSAERKSIFAWLHKLYSYRGPCAWFRSLVPSLVQGGIGRGFYMATFHAAKDLEESSGFISSNCFSGKLLAASSAGIAGWVFTYPFDVVRSNLIRDWQCKKFPGATFLALSQLHREGGLPRLYSGLGYTLLRAVPVAAVTLTAYDFSKSWILGIDSSGSYDASSL